jgi:DNA-binding transcriptional LysR family regulator
VLTIKQLEAFYWTSKLGTISKAGDRIHVTQSAVTKRLQEVEEISAAALFEPGPRKNRLTQKGAELAADCERLFALLDELDMRKRATTQPARILHMGLTELPAMVMFPEFIRLMKGTYPGISIHPEVDLSAPLRQKVESGQLDIAILPDPPAIEGLARIPLGSVPFGWFAAPGTFRPGTTYALRDLGVLSVIEQNADSIITELCAQLWENVGIQPARIYGGNNLNALAALIAAGVGISCLPKVMFEHDVQRGALQLVKTKPEAPSVTYYCCFLKNLHSSLGFAISDIAKQAYARSQGERVASSK